MIIRIIIVLVCIVFFINGCNSLISQFFGTHKLRTLGMEQLQQEGFGDSDYIEISDAWLSGEFVHEESVYGNSPPILLYPVLSGEEWRRKEEGSTIQLSLLAWTADFHSPCVEQSNCLEEGQQQLRGVVRELPEGNRNALSKLRAKGYEIAPDFKVINHNQAPVAWHWNLSMMLIPLGLAIGMEAWFNRKKS